MFNENTVPKLRTSLEKSEKKDWIIDLEQLKDLFRENAAQGSIEVSLGSNAKRMLSHLPRELSSRLEQLVSSPHQSWMEDDDKIRALVHRLEPAFMDDYGSITTSGAGSLPGKLDKLQAVKNRGIITIDEELVLYGAVTIASPEETHSDNEIFARVMIRGHDKQITPTQGSSPDLPQTKKQVNTKKAKIIVEYHLLTHTG